MSYFLFYIPVTLVVLLVLEACKIDDGRLIVKRTLKNFVSLTGALLAGSLIVYVMNRYL